MVWPSKVISVTVLVLQLITKRLSPLEPMQSPVEDRPSRPSLVIWSIKSKLGVRLLTREFPVSTTKTWPLASTVTLQGCIKPFSLAPRHPNEINGGLWSVTSKNNGQSLTGRSKIKTCKLLKKY